MNSSLRSATLLFFGLIVSSLLSYFFAPDQLLEHAFMPRILKGLIVLTMFCVGMLLTKEDVAGVFQQWPMVIAGTLVQYSVMPLLAFGTGKLLGFEGDALVGLVIVGSVPGAMASNVLTFAAGGNTSYSVSLTSVATLVSPFIVPLALYFLLQTTVSMDPLAISQGLALTVVLPVIAGHGLRRSIAGGTLIYQIAAPLIANVAILIIIAVIVGRQRGELSVVAVPLIVPLLTINIGGFCAGWLGGKLLGLTSPMRRALTLEVGMQNAGVGTVIAGQYFSEGATVAPAIYTFGCMFTGTLLAWGWSFSSARVDDHAAEE